MLKTFGTISLIVVVAAIATAGAYFTPATFMQVGVLVVSGVLAHVFVIAAQRAEEFEEVTDDSGSLRSTVARVMGFTLRVALGALVIVVTTMTALHFTGV